MPSFKSVPTWLAASALLIAAGFIAFGIYDNRQVDLWPPKIHSRSEQSASVFDISGDWKYKCTVVGTPFTEWGGTAKIKQDNTPSGVQWKLFGERLWETSADTSGSRTTVHLPTPYQWETNWGVVTSEPAVRFGYRIATAEGTIEGYAYGSIKLLEGKPDAFIGKFFQLPPYKAVHGKLEFRRMVNSADTTWQ